MATKTSLLGLTKPAYTDAADIAVLNTNFDLIDKAVGNGARVDNLIINGDFLNPVNHNGFTRTTGNGVKIIDMWAAESFDSGCVISLSSEGITLDCSAKIGGITYKFRNYNMLKGRTVTCAVCVNGAWECGSFKLGSNGVGIKINSLSVFSTGEHELLFRYNAPGMSITIQRVALYEGTYNAETLPKYVVPDKRIEMVRCDVPLNPPNLLDNSWFVNPINQRGSTEVSTDSDSYFIDRWVGYQGTFSLRNNSIQIQANRQYGALLQQFVQKLEDGVYTFAGKVDGSIVWRVVQISGNTVTTLDNNNAAFSNGAGYLYVQTQGDKVYNFHFRANAGYTIVVEWAALYEGAYDAETLPEYHYKGYAAELAECQRYYIKIATQPINGWCYNWGRVAAFVSLPVKMRVSYPTVVLARETPNFYVNATAYNAALEGSTSVENGVVIYYKHTAAINGQCVIPEFAAEINADL